VNLACEHIGVERTRSEAYFDGTWRKSLVKVIPFGHPLTPVDLEDLKRELEARADVDRPITLGCLGMELAAQTWIEDWHRLRRRKKNECVGKPEVNKIDVIELRTGARYGKFIRHEPASARVKVKRTGAGSSWKSRTSYHPRSSSAWSGKRASSSPGSTTGAPWWTA
jgi:hypothetical protein